MFIEPLLNRHLNKGWIEVIAGPMFSGKTEELIRRLKRAKIANFKVSIFKPKVDNRYSANEVVSHDANAIASIIVDRPIEIVEYYDDADVIGVDEVQFFNEAIVDVLQYLALKGKRVIVAGLDMDSNGKPFGPMPALLTVSEYVTKLHAICMDCGSLATHSYRLSKDKSRILIGEKDNYEPLCRHCFHKKTIAEETE
ncbi:MAG: thymidine kinase [Bacteroidetes bacterium]|jgi:thymidine kinase|nr:thymidine kinase [Bacteroidota bacterium]MBT5531276.1 thymidine kinase [Cytophagia bacterium]MBT3423327.1 thymidine kinase [Bacteroidota bacterium]MBT3801626.1 thymidine kinase [Bacteroidota bacterium]MBT3934366.1 thymidine kinase [Bacteroidota bacterium]